VDELFVLMFVKQNGVIQIVVGRPIRQDDDHLLDNHPLERSRPTRPV